MKATIMTKLAGHAGILTENDDDISTIISRIIIMIFIIT